MEPKPTPSGVVTGISERFGNRGLGDRSPEAGGGGPTEVVRDFGEIAAVIGKYGVTTAIFALPLVVACFGLYFLWIAVNGPAVNMAKVGVGIFTVVFGSGLLILLLWMFDKRKLWKKLTPNQEQKKAAA
ncbi:MAG: hypothetical protein WAQ52_02850 [Terriglobales bacterium]